MFDCPKWTWRKFTMHSLKATHFLWIVFNEHFTYMWNHTKRKNIQKFFIKKWREKSSQVNSSMKRTKKFNWINQFWAIEKPHNKKTQNIMQQFTISNIKYWRWKYVESVWKYALASFPLSFIFFFQLSLWMIKRRIEATNSSTAPLFKEKANQSESEQKKINKIRRTSINFVCTRSIEFFVVCSEFALLHPLFANHLTYTVFNFLPFTLLSFALFRLLSAISFTTQKLWLNDGE